MRISSENKLFAQKIERVPKESSKSYPFSCFLVIPFRSEYTELNIALGFDGTRNALGETAVVLQIPAERGAGKRRRSLGGFDNRK